MAQKKEPEWFPNEGDRQWWRERQWAGVMRRHFVGSHRMMAIDLFCGLGGWTEGLLDVGYEVVGFDLEEHHYGEQRYPAQLVLQDVRTIHGKQFKGATLIVASPPCQEYSYMAMPWARAKQIAADYEIGKQDRAKLTELFDACFRIRREASEAAGHHIPMIVENVRGAQKWVGRANWHYGSYYLWGDVPALMPIPPKRGQKVPGFRFDGSGGSFQTASVAYKSSGMNWCDRTKTGQDFTRMAGQQVVNNSGGSWFGSGKNNPRENCKLGRKAASAMIAKIPYSLSRYIGEVYARSAVPSSATGATHDAGESP